MRGADVFPLVELSSAPMKTKMGHQNPPRVPGGGVAAVGKWRAGPAAKEPPTTAAIGKPVAPVSSREALNDEIPI